LYIIYLFTHLILVSFVPNLSKEQAVHNTMQLVQRYSLVSAITGKHRQQDALFQKNLELR